MNFPTQGPKIARRRGSLPKQPAHEPRDDLKCQSILIVPNTVGKVLRHLAGKRLVKELTGQKRNRLFSYWRYLDILNEGTEPIS